MCGRHTLTTRRSDEIQAPLADTLGVETTPGGQRLRALQHRGHARGSPLVDDPDARRIDELRWGLVPHWAMELNTRFSMINARAETLDQRPAYRRLVARANDRCPIQADGWYELQRPEDPRQPRRPLHFSLASGAPFCFAGLWTRWTSPDGKVVPSCTIITCEANELVEPIHDRMPVVFAGPEPCHAWLHPSFDSAPARELRSPLPPEQMIVRPASPLVNSVRHEGPECLALPAAA